MVSRVRLIRRDAKSGKFLAGTAPGPGRKFSKTELTQAISEAVTPDEITAVIRRLLAAALKGSVPAAALLLDRIFGRVPLAAWEPDADEFDSTDEFL